MARNAGLPRPLQKPFAPDVDPALSEPKQVAPGDMPKATLPKMVEGEIGDRHVVHAHERQAGRWHAPRTSITGSAVDRTAFAIAGESQRTMMPSPSHDRSQDGGRSPMLRGSSRNDQAGCSAAYRDTPATISRPWPREVSTITATRVRAGCMALGFIAARDGPWGADNIRQ
jgi:hypothetical protein